jgi:hypothetical protein
MPRCNMKKSRILRAARRKPATTKPIETSSFNAGQGLPVLNLSTRIGDVPHPTRR